MTGSLEPAAGLVPFEARAVARALHERPVVIFGAGKLGKSVAERLRGAGVALHAFADNNPDLWGRSVDAIEVLRPEDAARLYADNSVFVIAVWHPTHSGGMCGIERQLRDLGCHQVIPFVHAFWAFPEASLPYYLWDLPSKIEPEWDAIHQAHQLFADDASRAEFVAQLEFRLTADSRVLRGVETHPQYFPEFLKPNPAECFIDCGAYDGDSIDSFLNWSGGRFQRIIAFEADPECFGKLEQFTASRPEIGARLVKEPLAVAARSGIVRFHATGQAGAAISEQGEIQVRSVALDDIVQREEPTFIKMDIEGAEPDALRGARETIWRTQPILAICVYHLQNHLWRLPLLMRELLPEARLFLRSYCMDGLDTVCYAVPEHRLIHDRGAL